MLIEPRFWEVRNNLEDISRHSNHMQYYIPRLDLGHLDPHVPHDLVGPGNKCKWPIFSGLSLQWREKQDPNWFKAFVLPAIETHRAGQYHHIMWGWPGKPHPQATEEDMKMGALDALCSRMEPRDYQGGKHTLKEIKREVIDNDFSVHGTYMWKVYQMMKDIEVPQLELITLTNFPNIGIPDGIYNQIIERTNETIVYLVEEHGYEEFLDLV